jgi:hypothetical protein
VSRTLSRACPPPRFRSSLISRQEQHPLIPPTLLPTILSIGMAPNAFPKFPVSLPDLIFAPSAGSSESASYALTNALASDPPSLPVTAPSALGLPVSLASGFGVLSGYRTVPIPPSSSVPWICHTRHCGMRRGDYPIVCASPTFCQGIANMTFLETWTLLLSLQPETSQKVVSCPQRPFPTHENYFRPPRNVKRP